MTPRNSTIVVITLTLVLVPSVFELLFAQPELPAASFKKSGSRTPYVHRIPLYDSEGRVLGPGSTAPYSTEQTCGKCHDLARIQQGFHSNPQALRHGSARPTEPDFLVDRRLGVALPLSVRGEAGTFTPDAAGLDGVDYWKRLGGHRVEPVAEASGSHLDFDCLVCHLADRTYSIEARAKVIASERPRAASTVAAGLGTLAKDSRGGEDADRSSVVYDPRRFDAEGQVFFDLVRSPVDSACLACHSELGVGEGATERWRHEEDVHTTAGLACVDCHGSGLDHRMVRGFEGEGAPNGDSTEPWSCRGCHYGDPPEGGRFRAPRPEHRGLPPLHLQSLSCTVCHSGTVLTSRVSRVQTSRAHELGVASQVRGVETAPIVHAPIHRRDEDGVIRPYREAFPSYWAWRTGDRLQPIALEDLRRPLRRALRVRQDFSTDVASDPDTFRAKVDAALTALASQSPEPLAVAVSRPEPVYVTGGRIWFRQGDTLESEESKAAGPIAWPVAHDVRPARQSLGAGGCQDCHAEHSEFVTRRWTIAEPGGGENSVAMDSRLGLDEELWPAWNTLFLGRDRGKSMLWLAIAIGALGLSRAALAARRRRVGS